MHSPERWAFRRAALQVTRSSWLAFLLVLCWGCCAPAFALTFSFTKGAGILALEGGTPAQQALAANVVAGFQSAANYWSATFNDPITVQLGINYTALSPGILGSTNVPLYGFYYNHPNPLIDSVRPRLQSDIKSAADATGFANLTPAAALEFYTQNRAGSLIFDNNGTDNNLGLAITSANGKALGLIAANDPTQDAAITFSSNFNWDFTNGPSIAPGKFDFIGTATHEIGHAMGFVSGVDYVDFFSTGGPGQNVDLNDAAPGLGDLEDYAVFSVLDLYRHSNLSNLISTTTLDLAYGGSPFFALDGTTNLGPFSTGQFHGDGWQTSHWKDNLGLGLMDPTLGPGQKGTVSALDVMALDVIGFDPVVVPEPASIFLAAIGLVGLLVNRCRRQRRSAHERA